MEKVGLALRGALGLVTSLAMVGLGIFCTWQLFRSDVGDLVWQVVVGRQSYPHGLWESLRFSIKACASAGTTTFIFFSPAFMAIRVGGSIADWAMKPLVEWSERTWEAREVAP